MKLHTLECCVDSVESALAAEAGGATRLELCADLPLGGTTPGLSLFRAVQKYCGLPVNVLIRPRFGDFCYTAYELEIMAADVALFCAQGANAVVIGVLCPDGTLDTAAMARLIAAAGVRPITLHRAFDVCLDPAATLEQAVALGVSTILTSGQQNTATDGAPLLNKLVAQAGGRLEILVGSGVNSRVIPTLYAATHALSYHLSGKQVVDSAMTHRPAGVSMGLPIMSEYDIWRTNPAEIAAARKALEKIWAQLQ